MNAMKNIFDSKRYIPQLDGKALDTIKIIAAGLMVLDHVNSMVMDGAVLPLFMTGRVVIPLFCFAVALSVLRAGDKNAPRYALRSYAPKLLLLAVLCEPVSRLTRDADILNIVFTLAFGAALAGVSYRLRDWILYAVFMAALAATFYVNPMEGSFAALALPAAFLMILRGKNIAWFFLLPLVAAINLGGTLTAGYTVSDICVPAMAMFACIVILFLITVSFARRISRGGRLLPKYFLHIFYPTHLIILRGIAWMM